MRTSILHCLLSGIVLPLFGQSLNFPSSFNSSGINACSQNFQDVFSISYNQAILASLKNASAGIYGEQRFSLKELSFYQVNAVLPVKTGGFGIVVTRFGSAGSSESLFSMAYGRSLSHNLNAGVQFNYYLFNNGSYGNSSLINFDAGIIFRINDQFATSIHINNAVKSIISKNKEGLPFQLSSGFGYDISKDVYFGCSINKTENEPVDINSQVNYRIDEKIIARLGVHSSNTVFYCGAGILLGKMRIEASSSIHPYLGLTPGLSLIFNPPVF
ncbi:MAG TPA: hypothetical protein VFQ58_00705 [Flavisolibacter sp.]|jgi:hypothetical protein|nr:hypothetical protein [Flavisolibacter sp.]